MNWSGKLLKSRKRRSRNQRSDKRRSGNQRSDKRRSGKRRSAIFPQLVLAELKIVSENLDRTQSALLLLSKIKVWYIFCESMDVLKDFVFPNQTQNLKYVIK